jgi:hypothetical protein
MGDANWTKLTRGAHLTLVDPKKDRLALTYQPASDISFHLLLPDSNRCNNNDWHRREHNFD